MSIKTILELRTRIAQDKLSIQSLQDEVERLKVIMPKRVRVVVIGNDHEVSRTVIINALRDNGYTVSSCVDHRTDYVIWDGDTKNPCWGNYASAKHLRVAIGTLNDFCKKYGDILPNQKTNDVKQLPGEIHCSKIELNFSHGPFSDDAQEELKTLKARSMRDSYSTLLGKLESLEHACNKKDDAISRMQHEMKNTAVDTQIFINEIKKLKGRNEYVIKKSKQNSDKLKRIIGIVFKD